VSVVPPDAVEANAADANAADAVADFDFSADQEAFRAELRAFLAARLPSDWQGIFVEGDAGWQLSLELCRELGERGWLTQSWPTQYGGKAASIWLQAILQEEYWAHNEPRGPQYMNVNWIGPALMHFGTEQQKHHFLPKMAAGEMLWAQGFSEPGAGSDLAALQCSAIPDGDGFVVNGNKIWISYGDIAHYCFLLCRTDPTSKRKQGLSVLLVDLELAGVSRRPIASTLGHHRINELFFDDVFVPGDALLGPLHDGWRVATAALAFERSGSARYARAARTMALVEKRHGDEWDDTRWEQYASLLAFGRATELVNYQVISKKESGEVPRVEASAARIHNSLLEQALSDFAEDTTGIDFVLHGSDELAVDNGELEAMWRNAVAATITAGSFEIQSGIIAGSMLALDPKR
jgi:alkylation response protein AidB-like acyl-CoA dehydrogenase